jgi:hypothetical protein
MKNNGMLTLIVSHLIVSHLAQLAFFADEETETKIVPMVCS